LCLALPAVHALVTACSLDLDESLIPGAGGDASTNDAPGSGGLVSDAQWFDSPVDATSEEAATDAPNESSTSDANESGPPDGIDCATTVCPLSEVCCFESGGIGACVSSGAECGSVPIQCDSVEDCGVAQVCCVLDTLPTVGCATSCPDLVLVGSQQLCSATAECASGMSCDSPMTLLADALPPGYKTCQ
jgi:hypothetical protein